VKPIVGKASGKRRLVDAMDQDLLVKKKKRQQESPKPSTPDLTLSKFFKKSTSSSELRASTKSKDPVPGPSRLGTDKENEYITIRDDTDAEDVVSNVAQGHLDSEMDLDIDAEESAVQQEDGYISPSPSRFRDTEELSSPPRPGSSFETEDLYQCDILSSPPSVHTDNRRLHQMPPSLSLRTPRSNFSADSSVSIGSVLVHASPEPEDEFAEKESIVQLDLQHSFGDDLRTEIDCSADSSSTPSPSPLTPDDDSSMTRQEIAVVEGDGDLEIVEIEAQEMHANDMRAAAVAVGWRERWALNPSHAHSGKPRPSIDSPALKRRETNVTPVGRHRFGVNFQVSRVHHPDSAPAKLSGPKALKGRRSLVFLDQSSIRRGLD